MNFANLSLAIALNCCLAAMAQNVTTGINAKPAGQPDVAALKLQTPLPKLLDDFAGVSFKLLDSAKKSQLHMHHSGNHCNHYHLDDSYYLQLAKANEAIKLNKPDALLSQRPGESHVEYHFEIESKSDRLIPLLAWPHGQLQLLDAQKRVQADNLAIGKGLGSFMLFGKQKQMVENFSLKGQIGLFLLDLAEQKSSGLIRVDQQKPQLEVLKQPITLLFNVEKAKEDEFGDVKTATTVMDWELGISGKEFDSKCLMSLVGMPLWMYEVEFFDTLQQPMQVQFVHLSIFADGRCARSYYCKDGFDQLGAIRINYVDTIRYTTLQQKP